MFIVGDTVFISKSFVEQIRSQAVTVRQKQALQILSYLAGVRSTVAAIGTVTAFDGTVLNHIHLIPPVGHLLYHDGDGAHMYFEGGTDVQTSAHKQSTYTSAADPSPNQLQWQKFTVTHTPLQTAATSNAITMFDLIPGGIIHGVKLKHGVAFAGGSLSAYSLSIGIGGNATKYLGASDVFVAPGSSAYLSSVVGTESQTAVTPILLTSTSVGDNLSASTGGTVDVWILISYPS